MKQNQYVIGVDGGGTKTDLSIADLSGHVITTLHKGTCSHEALPDSFVGTERILNEFMNELHTTTGITKSEVVSVVMGLCGVDTLRQWNMMDALVKKMGYPMHKVVNDSYLSIHASSPDGTGICSINGTGVVTGGIDASGKMLQVGGMGSITGDYGGGGYLAEKAVELAYSQLFRNGPATLITPRVLEILEVDDLSLFHDRIEERVRAGTQYRLPLMRALFSCCDVDPVAALAVKNTAAQLADSVIGCAKKLQFIDRIHVVCAGSIWQKAETPLLLNHFCEIVQRELDHRAEITVLKEIPVVGALNWAIRNYQL